jgi:hypothetical protein
MKFSLLLVLLFATIVSSAQQFTVASVKNNVLWAGRDNPLSITVENKLFRNIIARTDNGKLTRTDDGYTFYTDTGDIANITVFENRAGKEVEIGVARFHVRQLPDPIARVGFNRSGKISLGLFRSQAGLHTDIKTFYHERGIPIISYSVNIIRGTDFIVEDLKNDGNAFSPATREGFLQLRPGDSVVFNKIIARRRDGTLTILEPLTFSLY